MTTEDLAKVFAGESLQEPFVPAPSTPKSVIMPDIPNGIVQEQLRNREPRSLDSYLGSVAHGGEVVGIMGSSEGSCTPLILKHEPYTY